VKGALRPSNAKRLYIDEKSTEIGEIQNENRKVTMRKIGKYREIAAGLLLCLTSILVWVGWPYQEYTNSSQHSYPGH